MREPQRWMRAIVAAAAFMLSGALAAQTYSIVHAFSAEGGGPLGLIQHPDGTFLGTSFGGGVYGLGSVYSLTPDGAGGFSFSNVHSFTSPDGSNPAPNPLLLASNGVLYGATSLGQTLFRLD